MENIKNLGVWMDHATAELIDLDAESKNNLIESDFTYDTMEKVLQKGESQMHNEEQQMDEAYYKKIGDEVLKYDHVLLFGPTNAKTELHNYLNKDLHFKDIQIDVEPADKMTDNQKDAFVRNHFK